MLVVVMVVVVVVVVGWWRRNQGKGRDIKFGEEVLRYIYKQGGTWGGSGWGWVRVSDILHLVLFMFICAKLCHNGTLQNVPNSGCCIGLT